MTNMENSGKTKVPHGSNTFDEILNVKSLE